MRLYILLFCMFFSFSSHCQIMDMLKKAKKELIGSNVNSLSEEDIANGLKQALEIGVKNAVDIASAKDGFYKNNKIKIPFPPSAKVVEKSLRNIGMGDKVDDFVELINRAAEDATKKAIDIFLLAVRNITIEDGIKIVKGRDDEATIYLRKNTESELKKSFQPIIDEAISNIGLAKFWNEIATLYNKIPFTEKIEPNINEYVNQKTTDGIFLLVAEKEKDIRDNPAERVTDLLKKVFQ